MDFDVTRIGHLIWTGLLTLLGGVLAWNWNDLNGKIKDKADKGETQRQIDAILEDNRENRKAQADMHKENRETLNDIYQLLLEHRRRG